MTERQIKRLNALGLNRTDFEPKKSERIVHISREDFSLLDATADNTIYYIVETDGSVTMIKGDNR